MSDVRSLGRRRRQARILDAAEELFARQGFAKTTVDEIAVQAGVSKGLVYVHHTSKEDLLVSVWTRLVEGWEKAALSDKLAGEAAADAIGQALHASIRYAQERPLLQRILAQDPARFDPRGQQGIADFSARYRERLERVLARGVRRRELRPGLDVRHTAEVIWLLHFTLTRELFVREDGSLRADVDGLVEGAIALVVEGLRAPPTRSRKT